MWVITKARLLEFIAGHPDAEEDLLRWYRAVDAASWDTPVDVKHVFKDVDPVIVASGNTVYVFNIRRNEFRLIAAIHFDRKRVYVLRVMTHREYDRHRWKKEL